MSQHNPHVVHCKITLNSGKEYKCRANVEHYELIRGGQGRRQDSIYVNHLGGGALYVNPAEVAAIERFD